MAIRKKKGFTASQSKLTSRRMHSATIGTHVPRRAAPSSRRMNAEGVGFASSRKKKRAARGMVNHVMPATASGESASDYARRVSRREFTQEIQRKARVRRIIAIIVSVAVIACVAVGVGVATFFGSLDGKMSLGDSNAREALATAKEGEPSYALLAAELDSESPGKPDALVLVRIDERARAATFVSIPANVQVLLKDGKAHPLADAVDQGGDAALISSVADFAEVGISHFAKTDAAGLAHLVDALGGIEVELSEEVDDPAAGDVYLPAGTHTLDGKAALTFLRARNFKEGLDTQQANRAAFAKALSLRLLSYGKIDFITTLDGIASDAKTDWSSAGVIALADAMRGADAASLRCAAVPGYEVEREGVSYYVESSDAWDAVMALVDAGEDPAAATQGAPVAVDPAQTTLTVRNGTTVTGAAKQMADILAAAGYQIKETGNTDNPVYNETLVVYADNAKQDAAQAIVEVLGCGRAIPSNSLYTFESDVLVVVGKDWKPLV